MGGEVRSVRKAREESLKRHPETITVTLHRLVPRPGTAWRDLKPVLPVAMQKLLAELEAGAMDLLQDDDGAIHIAEPWDGVSLPPLAYRIGAEPAPLHSPPRQSEGRPT